MPPPLAETITIVNKSGKVMSSSKHLFSVFKDAQAAYRERKAELKAARKDEHNRVAALKAPSPRDHDDRGSVASSRTSSSRRDHRCSSRRPVERRHTEQHLPTSSRRRAETPVEPPTPRGIRRAPTEPLRSSRAIDQDVAPTSVARRRRSHDDALIRSRSMDRHDKVDMDLAYGELPPQMAPASREEQAKLADKMTALERLLEEAHCLQHSATAIIKNLEKNPEAMAAVGLTLAEISNIARKMAPGALATLGKAAPAVMALLLSPEFLIAVGVGVGITVVTLGGYKIIKQIKARQAIKMAGEGGVEAAEAPPKPRQLPSEDEYPQLEELNVDLTSIEHWRRGVSDAEARSVATSVDGEFITPRAAEDLRGRGVLPPKSTRSKSAMPADRSSKSKPVRPKESATKKSAHHHAAPPTSSGAAKKVRSERGGVSREDSGLRRMFGAGRDRRIAV